jgi:hypothetical protein
MADCSAFTATHSSRESYKKLRKLTDKVNKRAKLRRLGTSLKQGIIKRYQIAEISKLFKIKEEIDQQTIR